MMSRLGSKGFTLIELLMVILLTSVLATVSILTIDSGIDESRFDGTVNEMEQLRSALIGNTDLKEAGARTSFGYLGDIGSLPSNAQGLNALLANPGFPAWNVNTTSRFALGWNGPYLTTDLGADITRDAWDRAYTFNFTSNPATITSLGADGAAGGSGFDQDIVVQIPQTLQRAQVFGFISENGNPYSGTADIDLYYANGGALATMTASIAAGAQGHFSFNNVPLGRRSAMIFIPSRTSPTTTIGPVLFTVDSANYIIPSTYTDFGTPGSGGGGGGGGGGGCTEGAVTLVSGSVSQSGPGNKKLNFLINVSDALSVSAIKISATGGPSYSTVTMAGNVRGCSGSGTFTPCSAGMGALATFSPAIALTAGSNRAVSIDSTPRFMASSITVELTHSLGCDTLNIPIP